MQFIEWININNKLRKKLFVFIIFITVSLTGCISFQVINENPNTYLFDITINTPNPVLEKQTFEVTTISPHAILTSTVVSKKETSPSEISTQQPGEFETKYVAHDGYCGGKAPCFDTIQAAIDAIEGNFSLLKVASGEYSDVFERHHLNQVVYIDKSVKIQGGYSIDNWSSPQPEKDLTIIDAKNLGRAFYITGNVSVTIDGIHVTGGNASNIGGQGGGIFSHSATLVITNSEIRGNIASESGVGEGGGIFIKNGSSASMIRNCVIIGNISNDDKLEHGHGGGIYISYTPIKIIDNFISGNVANSNGSGIGGGIYVYKSSATIETNEIVSNTAGIGNGGFGGGIVAFEDGDISIIGNTIKGNSAPTGGGLSLQKISDANITFNEFISNVATEKGGGGILIDYGSNNTIEKNIINGNTAMWGGGMHLYKTSFSIINNLIINNNVIKIGGGIYPSKSEGDIVNNTVVKNMASDGGGFYSAVTSSDQITKIRNCIFWNNDGGEIGGDGYVVSYSNFETWNSGPNNISSNPLFVNPMANDYHLKAGSPCINAGTPYTSLNTDIEDTPRDNVPDMGAYEWIGVSSDL